MIFTELALKGVYLIEPERLEDERGFFARTFCVQEFSARGLATSVAQCNVSYNSRRGTVRGLHYQASPHEEVKLVRCTAGAVFDVVVDIRPGSLTLKKWFGVELSAENRKMLYIPEGVAHGFQTLNDNTEVFYQMSEFFHPECARGLRWDDPAFQIAWPIGDKIISLKDKSYPSYDISKEEGAE